MGDGPLARLAAMPTEARVKLLARAAMRQRLEETIEAPTPAALAWFAEVCEDLKGRVRALTPNRADLCRAWDGGFDVALLVQMVEHRAVDAGDVDAMIDLVFDRLRLVCAPAQDEAVADARRALTTTTPASRKLASLVDLSAAIVGDIEEVLERIAARAP